MKEIFGMIPPVITPFKDDENIDEEGLRIVLNFLTNHKVSGIFTLGTSSEFAYMDMDEKMRIVDIVIDQVKSKVPILMNVSSHSIKSAIRLIEHGLEVDIDGFVANVPQYFTLQAQNLMEYFTNIKKSCKDKPLFAYEVSSTVPTTATLTPDLIAELANNDIISGLKYSSGDWENYVIPLFKGLIDRKKLKFFIGSEIILRKFYEEKLTFEGGIFSGLNLFPRLYVEVFNAFQNNDYNKVEQYLPSILKVGALFGVVYPAGTPSLMKEVLKLIGLPIKAKVRAPLPPLNQRQQKKSRTQLKNYRTQVF